MIVFRCVFKLSAELLALSIAAVGILREREPSGVGKLTLSGLDKRLTVVKASVVSPDRLIFEIVNLVAIR